LLTPERRSPLPPCRAGQGQAGGSLPRASAARKAPSPCRALAAALTAGRRLGGRAEEGKVGAKAGSVEQGSLLRCSTFLKQAQLCWRLD